MVYSLMYRRPTPFSSPNEVSSLEKVNSINDSITTRETSLGETGLGGTGLGLSHGIPDALSFERITNGGTCPPCTVRDFEHYLKYVEFNAENLQFFLWYRDYCRRFNELPDYQQALAPEWVKDVKSEAEHKFGGKIKSPEINAVFKGTDFDALKAKQSENPNPFSTPPQTPAHSTRGEGCFESYMSMTSGGKTDHTRRASMAFKDAGLQWKPMSVQPYREEITRIISIYIADDGPRQLNISDKERTQLLHTLQNTTHPSAFAEIAKTVEWTLRYQAHPNFIRWTICNGNRPRVIFAIGLGIAGIVSGIATVVLITLSKSHRAWRVISILGFFIGISTLIAAMKGMCVVLHGMHHRHLHPWELFGSDGDEPVSFDLTKDTELRETVTATAAAAAAAADSEGPVIEEKSNSWEDEPWVAKYQKRNIIRKIFDREVWIQEPALRQIQDTIFLQAVLGALITSVVVVGVFCAFPNGRYF
ncbi:hypothetical protein GQ43DRAFT_433490 [Delitschia confertaspora ATCC 74209]|uniref:RGS domain-containing protein n=1 Tax=Delitschia confertaspora ATCC 74209 TaxID=1513339 RepID=A0A9P4JM54_9PLEO|nr:hypothetical protein GQ43DRAFT_433490 [Delitschia confertaspora ATCC 74209]